MRRAIAARFPEGRSTSRPSRTGPSQRAVLEPRRAISPKDRFRPSVIWVVLANHRETLGSLNDGAGWLREGSRRTEGPTRKDLATDEVTGYALSRATLYARRALASVPPLWHRRSGPARSRRRATSVGTRLCRPRIGHSDGARKGGESPNLGRARERPQRWPPPRPRHRTRRPFPRARRPAP